MINVDLTKAFHPRAFELLAAFMPGLFFEGSVLLARPPLVRGLVDRAGLDRYTTVFVALFAAFVLGNALMLWVRLIQVTLWRVYVRVFKWWPKLLALLVRRAGVAHRKAASELKPGQQPQPQSRYFRFLMWAQGRDIQMHSSQRDAQEAWRKVATVLLGRYGIDSPGRSWMPWVGVVGRLRAEYLRGSLLLMSSEATGWGGLAAIRFAPSLKTLPYAGLCLFLVAVSLLNDNRVAATVAHPVHSWQLGLDSAMAELKKLGAVTGESKPGPDDVPATTLDLPDDFS